MRIAVLGAGVAGLVAALRLTEAGHTVDVYERWPGLGGQAATLDVGQGHLLERYYHHLFSTDRHIAALYDELGMEDELEWISSSVAYFTQGRQWPFVTPMDLLRFKPLPPLARVRLGAAVLAIQRGPGNPAPFERITARKWIERYMGRDAYRALWGPLLRGKFGERADDVAMVWLQNKFRLRRGDDAAEEKLGYPKHSWELLFDALRSKIEAGGGRVLIDRPAARVEPGFVITPGAPNSFRRGHDPRDFETLEPERYEAVLATVPSDVFEQLAAPGLVPEAYLAKLRGIEYFTALCLLIELDRQFSPYYWTNIGDDALPFVGLIEHTNLIEPARYGGRRFLYVANYLPRGHELLDLDPESLLERYTPGLRAVNGEFERAWIKQLWLHREPAAQPIVTVGYRDKIPAMQTPTRGLVLANTTQIFPEDRGTNYAVREGNQAAEAMLGWLP
ncbi:MAG TPA: NAD(P)/FAD-dependent oxidoreductase [Solirubrobacter sp.]